VAALAGYFYRFEGKKTTNVVLPPRPVYPFVDCTDNDCNFPLTTGGRPSAETSVAVNPKDPKNIVASSNDLNTPSQDVWLHYYTTKDGGKTWIDGIVPGYRGGPPSTLTGMGTACDPALGFDMNDNVYLAGVGYNRHGVHTGRSNMIFVARSSNGGETFDQVTIVHTAWVSGRGQFNDKEWLAVDLNTGNVYVTWTIFTGNYAGQIVFSKSTNQGLTWSFPRKIADITGDINAQGSFVQVDKNSTIHVIWHDYTDDTIHYTRSKDEGSSWDPIRDIVKMTPNNSPLKNATYRVPDLPSMTIDNTDGPYGGSVYVTWTDNRTGDADAFMAFSRDWGDTWNDTYVRLNNDPLGNGADQFFPYLQVSEQGWVHAMFYDRRYDPNQTLIGVTYAVSVNGGLNFSINLNVTDTLFDGDLGGRSYWSEVTGDGSGFVGDYLGMGVTNDTAYLTWSDDRNAGPTDGNSDIYAAMVKFSGDNGSVNDTYNYLINYPP
jgi:hypothetical protein